jgi:hypothetical protein
LAASSTSTSEPHRRPVQNPWPSSGSSQVLGHVDRWLALEFAPHRLTQTIRDLAAAQPAGPARDTSGDEEAARKIAECDAKLTQYRAALDAGASPATVAAWISETEAERASYALATRKTITRRPRMTEAEIKTIVDKLADIARVLQDADPDDKAEVFRQLGLKLTTTQADNWSKPRSRLRSIGISTVSEVRRAPYVHDRHRPDHGVRSASSWCVVTTADGVIRTTTMGGGPQATAGRAPWMRGGLLCDRSAETDRV